MGHQYLEPGGADKHDVASIAAAACVAGAVGLSALGLVGTWVAWLSGEWALRAVLIAIGLALLGLLFGCIGLFRCRGGRRGGILLAQAAVVACGLGVGAVVASSISAIRAPLINDISTDLRDPPMFAKNGAAGAAVAGNKRSNALAYPTGFAQRQQNAYPDLVPLRMNADAVTVGKRVDAAIAQMRWQVTYTSPDKRTIEAIDVSRVFKFTDDIVIRLRATGSETIVDVRSRSRVGKGDLGSNARRIRAFLALLTP
ncbi:MAG: hypothetical protein ACI9W2_004462 [Gammaproteobacteria bacterium]|jgi:uncharacterized protein (DUF1499 family)